MKGRNGVCWPSGEQLPDRTKARPCRCAGGTRAAGATCPCPARHKIDDAEFGAGLVEPAFQNLQFAFPPDKSAEAPPDRCFKPRGSLPDSVEAIDFLRLGLAFDRVLAREARLDHPLHQAVRRFAHEAKSGSAKDWTRDAKFAVSPSTLAVVSWESITSPYWRIREISVSRSEIWSENYCDGDSRGLLADFMLRQAALLSSCRHAANSYRGNLEKIIRRSASAAARSKTLFLKRSNINLSCACIGSPPCL